MQINYVTRNTRIEARGEANKKSGMEGGENWSELCSLGGRVSTLALILEGEMLVNLHLVGVNFIPVLCY